VSSIVRLKSYNKQEYLYSLGTVFGFNSLGILVSYPSYKPEVYTRTHWLKERNYNSKTGRIEEKITSPNGLEEIYLVPFSAEAVDELFSKTIKPDTPRVYIRHNSRSKFTVDKPCNFVVKDLGTGVAINVQWGDINRTLELFKTKSFEYLFNCEYIPEPVKAEMRARTEGITGEKIQQDSPKIKDNTNTNTNTVNNTSVYK
jgi:hypothetical protein